MVAVSNRKCGRYVAFLQQYDANVNSSFGILAQATAILASVSSGGTAQGFAAASGISSGTRGTLNEAHFQNETIGVLANAFEIGRGEQREEITRYQQCPTQQYTLMRGMEDVFRYHASCSIVFGLKRTQRSVEQSRAPNLDVINAFLDKLEATQARMKRVGNRETVAASEEASGVGTQNGLSSSTPVIATPTTDNQDSELPTVAEGRAPTPQNGDTDAQRGERPTASRDETRLAPQCPFSQPAKGDKAKT